VPTISKRIVLLGLLESCWTHICPLSRSELSDGVDFLTHKQAPTPEPELPNCTWYRKSTCCTTQDALRISYASPEVQLVGTTRSCRDVLNLLMCSVCSPNQSTIFREENVLGFPVPVLQVCGSFCDALHRACAGATLVTGRDRLDMEFEDGRSLCDAVGLRVAVDTGAECFSSARPRPAASIVGLAVSWLTVMALHVLTSTRGSRFHRQI